MKTRTTIGLFTTPPKKLLSELLVMLKEKFLPVPEWMSEEAQHTLSEGYLLPGETPRDMWRRVAKAVHQRMVKMGWKGDFNLEEELFEVMYKGWLGLASPVASNMGTNRGKPISCYSVEVGDSILSIYSHKKEVSRMSQEGGGVGVYLSNLRHRGSPISRGGASTGVLPWAIEYDVTARTVNQGGVRRGSFAFYLRVDHPDLKELLLAKDHSQGDPRSFIDSNIAVVIPDDWMESMLAGDEDKFNLFSEIISTRLKSGSPYLLFIDNVNNQRPQCYKDRGLLVKTSNLCSEITLFTDEDHSFVCVLSSLNLSRYDEWKNWVSPSGRSLPELAVWLLDAVVEEFIVKARGEGGMGRAVRFAEKSRALGLGTMGLHLLYQKRGFPFASDEARALNIECHKLIQEQSLKASQELAKLFGEPEWCEGHGIRHTHRTAIAPTKTNSVISGAFSQGIEPIHANVFVAVQAKGDYLRKNPVLQEVLASRGMDITRVWNEIIANKGSIQSLPYFSEEEKQLFLTAREIDQKEIVRQAADRQPYVDQAQSVNLWVPNDADPLYLLDLHICAWKWGLNSLYYLKSESPLVSNKASSGYIITKENCPWCEKLKEEVTFEYIEIDLQEAKKRGYWNEEWKTVPQLWIDGVHIGGYDDFVRMEKGDFPQLAECQSCEA